MPCLYFFLMYGWTKQKYWKSFTQCFQVGENCFDYEPCLSEFLPFSSALSSLGEWMNAARQSDAWLVLDLQLWLCPMSPLWRGLGSLTPW